MSSNSHGGTSTPIIRSTTRIDDQLELGGMEPLGEARVLFERHGLALPPVPTALQGKLRRLAPWCYATREISPARMYAFGPYAQDVVAEVVDDYAALSHWGHGVNSYSLNYALVYKFLALFVQVGWGGIYMDKQHQTAKANTWFGTCAHIVDAVEADAARSPPRAGKLVVLQSEFSARNLCAWLPAPTGAPDVARRWIYDHSASDTPALKNAEAWLSQRSRGT